MRHFRISGHVVNYDHMKKILVIEDDTFIASIIIDELKKAGYDVRAAQNGLEGIEAVLKEKPDLILLDLLMPKADGFQVLGTIKKDPATSAIPVVVLSNYGQPKDIARAKELGAMDFLIKVNFTPKAIIEKVSKILEASATAH